MTEKKRHHFLSIDALDSGTINTLLQKAEHFLKQAIDNNRVLDSLSGRIVAHLFFESSTRTRNSFEIAAKRLGALVLSPDLDASALRKGESLLDTIHTLEAMGVSLFVIRHPENGVPEWIAQRVGPTTAVINAGDGTNQHPTQCLIDLLTIHQHKKEWQALTVAIVGDILHSRVARSMIAGLALMNVAHIRLIGPPELVPMDVQASNVAIFHSLEDGLKDADVVITLRLQQERIKEDLGVDTNLLYKEFCVTPEKLALAKPDAIVMHPGPMNRDVEISSAVADGPQSVISQQVRNGVAIRMAVMGWLTN